MNGSNLTFSMTLLIFMKQSKEDLFFVFSLLLLGCMYFVPELFFSLYSFTLSFSLSLLLSLLFKLLIFWISGNHNHLYALRTLSRTCHFQQTMYNDAGDERPVNRRNMRMKRSKRTHRVRREQNERKEQPPPSQQRIIENEWKWDTEVQTNTKKNERHERIITVIFIGK